MTVKEAIEILSKFDPDYEFLVFEQESQRYYPVSYISKHNNLTRYRDGSAQSNWEDGPKIEAVILYPEPPQW